MASAMAGDRVKMEIVQVVTPILTDHARLASRHLWCHAIVKHHAPAF